MKEKNPRVAIIASALSLAGGVVGTAVGSIYGAAFGTDPAWIGPAFLVAGIGAVIVGVLLLPAAIRAFRSGNAP